MYLAIMLIVVSILVFYNELNNKMNIAEIALLAIALIAIIRASLNYINMTDTITTETFTNNMATRSRKNGVKNKGKNKTTNSNTNSNTVLYSNDASEYFDTLETPNKTISSNLQTDGKISHDAVNQVNSLLGISKFNDLPTTASTITSASTTTTVPAVSSTSTISTAPTSLITPTNPNLDNAIESTFRPQIIIGSGDKSSYGLKNAGGLNGQMDLSNTDLLSNRPATWQTAFKDDSMTFPNTMAPSSNLWGTATSFGIPSPTDENTWTQSMNDYNNGRWNPQLYQRPSDYTDYYTPSAYGMNTPKTNATKSSTSNTNHSSKATNNTTNNTTSTKRCGVYDDLSLDQAGNLVVRNYTEAKKWYPGYTYVPPVYWDVPQRHTSVCNPNSPDYHKLTGLVDRGLPMNVLELNPDGKQANTEETVKLSNVGSIMPQFNYQEMPFSKPYV